MTGKGWGYTGIGVDITDPKIAYFGSNASEKYFSDGTMLFELEFVFREDMADAPRGIDIRIREYEYGAEWEEHAWPITITPITHMTVARARLDQPIADGLMTAESLTFMRSEIGSILYLSCRLSEKLSEADIERLNLMGVEAKFDDDTIESICTSMLCFNAQGENIYFEQATGGETFLVCMRLGAGNAPAKTVNFLLHDYAADKDMSGFETELIYE